MINNNRYHQQQQHHRPSMASSKTPSTSSLLAYILLVVSGIILLAVVTTVPADEVPDDYFYRVSRARPRKMCGRHLREMVALVCMGSYNQPAIKRGGGTQDLSEDKEPEPNHSPFLSPESALSFVDHQPIGHRQTRSGLADECCAKPCTIREISSYCD